MVASRRDVGRRIGHELPLKEPPGPRDVVLHHLIELLVAEIVHRPPRRPGRGHVPAILSRRPPQRPAVLVPARPHCQCRPRPPVIPSSVLDSSRDDVGSSGNCPRNLRLSGLGGGSRLGLRYIRDNLQILLGGLLRRLLQLQRASAGDLSGSRIGEVLVIDSTGGVSCRPGLLFPVFDAGEDHDDHDDAVAEEEDRERPPEEMEQAEGVIEGDGEAAAGAPREQDEHRQAGLGHVHEGLELTGFPATARGLGLPDLDGVHKLGAGVHDGMDRPRSGRPGRVASWFE